MAIATSCHMLMSGIAINFSFSCPSPSPHFAASAFTTQISRVAVGRAGKLSSSVTYEDAVCIGTLPTEMYNEIASRHPQLAQDISKPNAFIRPTDEWLCQYLSLSKSDEKRMNARLPDGSIKRLGRHRLHEWLAFFLSDTVGLDNEQLRRMLVSRPILLSYKLSNVKSTTEYFREELGLSSTEFASVLRAYPSVLMYSIDNRLRPTVSFLQNKVGGGKDNWTSWKRVILKYPKIFSQSIEKTLLPKVDFVCDGRVKGKGTRLGLTRSELSQVVGKFPPILWLSEKNLQSKLDFLNESLGLNDKELRAIIVAYPQVLGLSLEKNLIPKMIFFLGDNMDMNVQDLPYVLTHEDESINCGLSKDQLKEFVLYQPPLLAYSFEKRLKPRISRMQEHNIL